MNTAAKGRRLEHELRHLLEDKGWSVMRGAGSKGKLLGWDADLIATKWTDQNIYKVYIVGLQCKVHKA